MAKRAYGQYCGVSRALEMVGERWSLLILRDLMVGPRRYTDLRRGLPRIPTNILADRLRELEASGIIVRRALPQPAVSVVYELTDYGRELEPVLVRLGRWGAQRLSDPHPDEIVTVDSMTMAMRTTFRAGSAHGLNARYELRMGHITLHIDIHNGNLAVSDAAARSEGPPFSPDLVIEAGPGIRALMAGEITASEAVERGVVKTFGDVKLLSTFANVFRI